MSDTARPKWPSRKFNFWQIVRTPVGTGKIIGICRGSNGWTYKTDADDPDDNDPTHWWREEVLSLVEENPGG